MCGSGRARAAAAVLLVLAAAAAANSTGGHGAAGHFTPTWAVHVPGGSAVADAVAAEHDFVNLGEIFDNHYHFHNRRVTRRSVSPAHAHHARLSRDTRVHWARQQRLLSRVKRDFIMLRAPSESPRDSQTEKREKRETSKFKSRPSRPVDKFVLNDPKWPHMWYLNRGGGLDMNVIPAWREGISGRGVVVTILDDGLETDHPDLIANYDAQASYDVNSHDSDPQPRYDMIDSNRHGTRCAGEVAAMANNSLCAVGIAFGAKVGGVRMLDGDVTDAVEARSLSLNPQHVDIYSASWGPDDDGKTVDGPGELATRAFIEGVTKGRNGKGSIFVWASGNGGRDQDNCNCDGYTNSIWTLSISSATERGDVPWYSEMCSSTLAATYSSGGMNEKQVVTTDLHHSCTSGHTGTSASAPLAAGICALTLQANRELTWRDMQHIVVRTARPERLSATGGWRVNGVGRNVSHSFGYGLLDAAAMVRLARTWRTVPAQRRCELAAMRPERAVPARGSVVLHLDVQRCPGVNHLEHVQAKVTMSSARRGDLQIFLTSPAGTRVTLLAPRAQDTSRAGFNSWPFMSVHTWGESPIGVWQLEVHNEGRYMGDKLTQWELVFYGTETAPQEDILMEGNGLGPAGQERDDGRGSSVKTVTEQPHKDLHAELGAGIWEDTQKHHGSDEHTGSSGPHGATSGCLSRSSSSDRCIECLADYYIFDGRCYLTCPVQTYSSILATLARSHHYTPDGTNVTAPPNFTENTSLAKRAPSTNGTDAPRTCLPCHYTCAACSGPTDRDCESCHSDAELVNVTSLTTHRYCVPTTLAPSIGVPVWYYHWNVIVSIVAVIVGSVGMFYLCSAFVKRGLCESWCCGSDGDSGIYENVSYDKVADDEAELIKEEIERAARSSGSESEGNAGL